MGDKKIKWLIYTVLVGIIPILCRLLVWAVTKAGTVEMAATSDFIAFGLVLHISNINEIEHFDEGLSWKTVQNGVSITFIAFYSVLFSLVLVSEGNPMFVDDGVIKVCAVLLSTVSFMISFSVFHRISNGRKLGEV